MLTNRTVLLLMSRQYIPERWKDNARVGIPYRFLEIDTIVTIADLIWSGRLCHCFNQPSELDLLRGNNVNILCNTGATRRSSKCVFRPSML